MDQSQEIGIQAINETYKIWKKNVPFLYDVLQSYELPTCSQTVEWFVDEEMEGPWRSLSILIGTNSLFQNYFQLVKVTLPTREAPVDHSIYQEERTDMTPSSPGYVGTLGLHQLYPRLSQPQSSEVMRARINPLHSTIVAVKTGGHACQTLLYDLRNREGELEETCLKLAGHVAEGFGLSWNLLQSNKLLSGSLDRRIALWDINSKPQQGVLSPIYATESDDGIEDVKWTKHNENIFASAHQNGSLFLWDTRRQAKQPVIKLLHAHSSEIFSLDFNPFSQFLLLSGGEDSDVSLWDIRNLFQKVNTFVGHSEGVSVVSWNPSNALQFASGSADRRIVIWDIEKIGLNTRASPGNEIIFIHGGHRTRVTDLSWSRDHVLASCEENNILQVWQMNQRIRE